MFIALHINYIFELCENDLFISHDDKYYFLVIFEGEETADYIHKWMFGEPLLKKYTFIFDHINYKIGFYNPLIPRMKIEKKVKDKIYNYSKLNYIAILIVLFIISIFLIMLLKLVKNHKKNKIDRQPYTELQNISI